MKTFTDIEQSKRLAEILPFDTADMWWPYYYDVVSDTGEYTKEPLLHKPVCDPDKALPCWSLAALLEVLPDRIYDRYDLVLGKLSANDGWYVCYEDNDLLFQHYHFHKHYVDNNNLFDACVEMITILNKENEL